MANSFLTLLIASLWLDAASASHVQGREAQVQQAQYQDASTALSGTWSSADGKPFAYTFYPNGTYAYAGAMGGYPLATQISESGTYAVSGTDITIQRQTGLIASTNGYRQPLYAQTTMGRVGVVNTQGGPRMVLAFPDGRVFYK